MSVMMIGAQPGKQVTIVAEASDDSERGTEYLRRIYDVISKTFDDVQAESKNVG